MSEGSSQKAKDQRNDDSLANPGDDDKAASQDIGSLFNNVLMLMSKRKYFSDIDLADPEVEAAAAKIQAVFKMKGMKTVKKKEN